METPDQIVQGTEFSHHPSFRHESVDRAIRNIGGEGRAPQERCIVRTVEATKQHADALPRLFSIPSSRTAALRRPHDDSIEEVFLVGLGVFLVHRKRRLEECEPLTKTK